MAFCFLKSESIHVVPGKRSETRTHNHRPELYNSRLAPRQIEKPRRIFREDDFYRLAASSRSSVNNRIAGWASIGSPKARPAGMT
jgi:hypothetical protein